MFTTSRDVMKGLVAPRWMALVGWLCAGVIVAINVKLLFDFVTGG
jgi:manganese transport protein